MDKRPNLNDNERDAILSNIFALTAAIVLIVNVGVGLWHLDFLGAGLTILTVSAVFVARVAFRKINARHDVLYTSACAVRDENVADAEKALAEATMAKLALEQFKNQLARGELVVEVTPMGSGSKTHH